MEERRMSDSHGERLARIEESIKSLGRSVDGIRQVLTDHVAEEKELVGQVNTIERDLSGLRGGAKVFFMVCTAGAFVITIATQFWT